MFNLPNNEQKDSAPKSSLSGFSFGIGKAVNAQGATGAGPSAPGSSLFTIPVQPKSEQGDTKTFGGLRFESPATPTRRPITTVTRAKGGLKQATELMLDSQWRNVEWTEEKKSSLMETISAYRPSCDEVPQARVLLLGPVGSGKSSFISSVQSVFSGRVTNRAMVGSSSTGFTKMLQCFNIRVQQGKDPSGLVLCDTMGLGDGEMTGPTLHDILSVIKGHVPQGHKFSPGQPVSAETVGYVKSPGLADKIHCVVFVVDASQILKYPKGLSATFEKLREHISGLGVHQVALLTHVDKISSDTARDASMVYKSHAVQETMDKAAALLGMSTSYIVPVRNYSSELDLDTCVDVLLLSAVDHILQYAALYFQDNTQPKTVVNL